jgi:hypothetical protein
MLINLMSIDLVICFYVSQIIKLRISESNIKIMPRRKIEIITSFNFSNFFFFVQRNYKIYNLYLIRQLILEYIVTFCRNLKYFISLCWLGKCRRNPWPWWKTKTVLVSWVWPYFMPSNKRKNISILYLMKLNTITNMNRVFSSYKTFKFSQILFFFSIYKKYTYFKSYIIILQTILV